MVEGTAGKQALEHNSRYNLTQAKTIWLLQQFNCSNQGCTGQPFFASGQGGAEEKNFRGGVGQGREKNLRAGRGCSYTRGIFRVGQGSLENVWG